MAEQKHTQDPLDMEEALSTSEAFLIKYKGKILGTIAAVVIIIAGFMGYKHFISEPNEMKASEALFKGEQYFGADNFETALNGDSIGYKGFLKVADEFRECRVKVYLRLHDICIRCSLHRIPRDVFCYTYNDDGARQILDFSEDYIIVP